MPYTTLYATKYKQLDDCGLFNCISNDETPLKENFVYIGNSIQPRYPLRVQIMRDDIYPKLDVYPRSFEKSMINHWAYYNSIETSPHHDNMDISIMGGVY